MSSTPTISPTFPAPSYPSPASAPWPLDYAPSLPPNIVAPPPDIAEPEPYAASSTPSPTDLDFPQPENTGAQFYQSPTAPPVVLDEYPPLVVLKSGGVYAVKKYWVKAKTLYFLTPTGQTFQAPLNQLEQIYPGTKRARND